MTRPIIITIGLLVALLMGCGYQAPPGGTDAYCWRVEQDRLKGSNITVYTNTEPARAGHITRVVEAWYAFHNNAHTVLDRFDRYADVLLLDDQLGPIIIEPSRCST